jgi:Flp pilus assembly pilin Flp
LVEYALLACLIALTAVFALGEMGKQVITFFNEFVGKLNEINMGR